MGGIHYARRAMEHLVASGALCISIARSSGTFMIADKPDRDALVSYWLRADRAEQVARLARSMISRGDVVAALHRAAAQCGTLPIRHDRAILAAREVVRATDEVVEAVKADGTTTPALIKRFQSYKVAEQMLRVRLARGSALGV